MLSSFVSAAEDVLGITPEQRQQDTYDYSAWLPGSLPLRSRNSEALAQRWQQSLETDFSVYQGPAYDLELLYCWEHFTGPSLYRMIDFLMSTVVAMQTLRTTLDLEGGIGMSSLLLAHLYPALTHVAHVPHHYDVASKLVSKVDRRVLLASGLGGLLPMQPDLLIAQEVFEHFPDPVGQLSDVLGQTDQPKFYYDGSSFELTSAPGHFRHNKHVRPQFNRLLQDRGYEVVWRDIEFSARWTKTKPLGTVPTLWYHQ